MSRKWPSSVRRILVEKAANGAAVITTLKGESRKRVSRQAVIVPVRASDSKEARLSAVAHLFSGGNVYIRSGQPWTEGYVKEIVAFPNATRDDQVDGTTQALISYGQKKAVIL